MSKYFELIITMLSGALIFVLIVGIVSHFSGTKTDNEQHITCLELGIGVENCNKLFKE